MLINVSIKTLSQGIEAIEKIYINSNIPHFQTLIQFGCSLNTTTIYSGRENVPGGYFASVASRHPYIIGPKPSQRYGKCKVLEYHQ